MKRFTWLFRSLEDANQLDAVFKASLELLTGRSHQDQASQTYADGGGYTLPLPGMTWFFGPPEESSWAEAGRTYYLAGWVEPHDAAQELWLMLNLPAFVVPEELGTEKEEAEDLAP